tara:strand:- start:367 stop:678 length:312 start_codon:yes stop_codon:yes gene_type:complete
MDNREAFAMIRRSAYDRGYADGYAQAIADGSSASIAGNPQFTEPINLPAPAPTRRKASKYNRKYKAAFRKVAPKYKLKSGKWRNNGFRRAVKEAHKIAGGKKR